jgi:MFS family permease
MRPASIRSPRSAAAAEPSLDLPRRRWRIAWLLGLGVFISYLDRINLSVAHTALISSFAISDVTFGYLSAAYNWTYMFCQIPVGMLLDRFGVRLVSRIGAVIWSTASFAAALTPSLAGFFAARFLLGVGEAPLFPANAKAIGRWFPSKDRSLPTGLFDGASKFSNVVGVPFLGYVLLRLGWRWCFSVTGIVSLLYFALFYKVYRDPEDDPGLSSVEREYIQSEPLDLPESAPSPVGRSASYLLAQRKVIGLALGSGAYNYVFYLLLAWLPSYLSSALHIDSMHSFLYTGVPWLIATIADLLVGGWLVNKLIAQGRDEGQVRRVVLIAGTALGLCILGAARAHSAGQALLWISISIGGLSAAAPITWSLPSLIAPRESVGTLGGIMNMSNQISGIAAPIVTGYVVTAFHSFAWAFGISAAYLLVGIAAYAFLLGPIERIPEQIPAKA